MRCSIQTLAMIAIASLTAFFGAAESPAAADEPLQELLWGRPLLLANAGLAADPGPGARTKRYEICDLETTVLAAEPDAHVSRNSIKVLPDGAWAMIYNRANNHGGTEWSCVNIRFSKDGGKSWSDENRLLDGSRVRGLPCGNPDGLATADPWLYLAPNGDLVIHFWRIGWRDRVMKGTWAIVSEDGGRSWSSPEQVKFEGIANDNFVFCGEQDFCVDGRLYAGFREFAPEVVGPGRCFFAVSDDNGRSFKLQGIVAGVGDDSVWFGESGYEYLGGQDVIAVVLGQRAKDRRQLTFVSYSRDLGKTWSDLREITSQTDAIHRPRVYTRKHLQGAAEWWDDEVLICTGTLDQSRANDIDRGRTNSVWISPDRGRSWTTFWGLDAKYYDGGYGDLAYDPEEGKFVVVMYTGDTEEAVLKQYRFRILENKSPL